MLAAALNKKRDKPKEGDKTEHDELHNRFRSDPTKAFTENDKSKKSSDKTYFEFFDQKMLKHFLYERDKPYDGVL
jgi:hypothetical protein